MEQERRRGKEEVPREMNYSRTSGVRKETERWEQKKKRCAASLWTRCMYKTGEKGKMVVQRLRRTQGVKLSPMRIGRKMTAPQEMDYG